MRWHIVAGIKRRLVNAIKIGSFAEIIEAVNAGAHPDTADEDGETGLMAAARQGHAQCAGHLLSRGANPNMSRPDGWSAAMWAIANGHGECLGLLLRAGANPNARAHGRSAVMESVRSLSAQCLAQLVEAHADVEDKNSNGLTAISMACVSKAAMECLTILLSAGADPNVADNDGVTPAMVAAIHGNAGALELLLASGANPQAKDKDGWSAARHASQHSRGDMALVLDAMSIAMQERIEMDRVAGPGRQRVSRARI